MSMIWSPIPPVIVSSYPDGSSGALTGTIQYPTILNSYGGQNARTQGLIGGKQYQPPWNVAGVDYAVGIPSSVTLQDPWPGYPTATVASLASAFVTQCGGSSHVSVSGNQITINPTTNATISGWDFSLHNGIELYVQNCTNPTITSNKFGVGSNLQQPLLLNTNMNGGTIEYNEITGAGLKNQQVGFGLIEGNAYGTITIQYNYIHDAYSELLTLGNSPSGTTNWQVQYNVLANAGLGQPQGAHGDWVQIVSASAYSKLISATFTYNLCIQNNTTTNVGAQGFSFNGNAGYFFGNEYMTYNTVIAATQVSGGGVNTFFNCDYSWLTGTGLVSNNFCDPTGINDGINDWVTIVSGSGGQPNTFTGSGNMNMLTGLAMPTQGNIT